MGTEEKAPGKADRRSGAVDNGGTGMKIQEFSTLYGLSVRTVRYYVQLGLLRPGKGSWRPSWGLGRMGFC